MRRFRATIAVVGDLNKLENAILDLNQDRVLTVPYRSVYHIEVRAPKTRKILCPVTESPNKEAIIAAVQKVKSESLRREIIKLDGTPILYDISAIHGWSEEM